MTNTNNSETVYGINGEKVGVVEEEGGEFVAYNLSDLEVYRGTFLNACRSLQGL